MMDAGVWISLLAIAVLLIASFFFSAAETSITAASRARMHRLARSGNRRAGLVETLTADKERLIGAILVGNNLVNILASTLAAGVLIRLFGDAGIAYATVAMTATIVVFTEVLPKTLALLHANGLALAVAPALRVVTRIFSPITSAVQVVVNAILRAFGLDARNAGAISAHEELRSTVDFLHAEGGVRKHDRDMLGGVLDLHELDVSDVMVHRTQMLALNADLEVAALIEAVLDSPYAQVPLWRGSPDNIVGVLHGKELLSTLYQTKGNAHELTVDELADAPWFVPETTSARDQLHAFLKRRSHFALVVNEYGEVQGVVTLEDILEEIVGDIADEHESGRLVRHPDGSFTVDGALPVRDLNRALDWSLPDEKATTIAGLVIHETKRIPDAGEQFTLHGLRVEVLRKTRHRITQLRLTPLATEAPAN